MPVFTGITLGLTALAEAGAAAATSIGTAAAAAGASIGGATAAGLTAGETAAAVGSAGAAAAPWAAGTTVATTGSLATAAGAAGTGLSLASGGAQLYSNQQSAQAQQRQEALRAQQMHLESDRQRREVIRQTQIAQATGINNASQSGADITGGSTLQGIVGQNETNKGFALNTIKQNEAIGSALFDSNAQESGFNAQASLFGGTQRLGNTLSDNNMQIGRLGTTLFSGT